MSLIPFTRAARPLGTTTCALALAVLLVGCGSDDTTGTASDSAPADVASGAPAGGPGGGGAMPGAFGEIAAVDGDVLQVQSQMTGQVAVTVTDATTITDQAAATLADVAAGVCVVVRTADGGDAGSDGAATEVTASSVAISEAGDDGCAAGFGGGGFPGGGERPTDMPTDLPTDLPSDFPSDMPSGGPGGGGRPGGGFGTVGEVKSVSADGFVVEGQDGDVTVTVGTDTTYTKQVASDSSALTVGRCVQAQGDADDTGAVTAETIRVSDKVDDQCGR